MTADEAFCGWAADHLLVELRAGSAPSLPASAFVWEPFLTVFRRTAGSEDRALVAVLLADEQRYMFGGLLSRAFPDDVDVTATLLQRFRAEPDEERAIGLLHQLAARPMGDEVRFELVAWLTANADAFIDEQRRFFGGADGRAWFDKRMTDPAYAEKRWVYLFSALALDPSEGVTSILEEHLDHEDPVVVEAARSALALAASRGGSS